MTLGSVACRVTRATCQPQHGESSGWEWRQPTGDGPSD
jgi:hypothetical protein